MPGYCELIDTAYAMTMPPTSTGAPAGDPDYLNHVTALKAACKKAP
jgi:hypothetical protein